MGAIGGLSRSATETPPRWQLARVAGTSLPAQPVIHQPKPVIPAKAGIQKPCLFGPYFALTLLDSGLRRNDALWGPATNQPWTLTGAGAPLLPWGGNGILGTPGTAVLVAQFLQYLARISARPAAGLRLLALAAALTAMLGCAPLPSLHPGPTVQAVTPHARAIRWSLVAGPARHGSSIELER